MATAVIDASAIAALGHAEAMRLAETEHQRLLQLICGFGPQDWGKPTDCGRWDVHALVAHLIGNFERTASVRENLHQTRLGAAERRRAGGDPIDAITAVQVRERAGLGHAELITRLDRAAPRALKARQRLPGPVRVMRVRFAPPIGRWAPVGYLFDQIMTRDVWMHRVDLTRASGQPMHLTADHDGRLVATVVADWAGLHRQPFALTLTGPAGGSFARGHGGETAELDAVEFCRILSGRGSPGTGLLAQRVPF